MADAFATEEMQGTLNDVSNDISTDVAKHVSNSTAPADGDTRTAARRQGWAEPSSYDYEEYGKQAKDNTAVDTTLPMWGHNAQKYEWREDYGDIGPRNEELEQMLYHSEFITRQGIKFDA
jgi:ATP-dependent RNA helicase DDX3X